MPASQKTYVGDLQRLVEDGLEQLHPVLAAVGGEAGDHLVDDAAEAPPVNGLSVALLLDDLRRQVLGSPADGHCLLVLVDEGLGQAEVSQLYVSGLVKEDVLRLEAKWGMAYSL